MTIKPVFDTELINESSGFCNSCKKPFFTELLISEYDNYGCWACGKQITIIMVSALLAGNDKLSYHERSREGKDFFLSYLDDEHFGRLISQKFPLFFKDYSKFISREYFMNHCSYCNTKQGDYYVYDEWVVELSNEEEITKKSTIIRISDDTSVKYFITGEKSGNEFGRLNFFCENCFGKKTSDFLLFKKELRKKKIKSSTGEDYPFWLPVSVEHAEEIGELINDEYIVTCVYDKIDKFLDFDFEPLQIGWVIKIPSELITRFQANLDEYPLFANFVSSLISSNPNQYLREYEITKTKINLIYANTSDIEKYMERLISKKE